MSLRIGSLCSGYGGLDLGVQAALDATVVWHCDNDAGATRILAHHHPDTSNHGDLTATDWADVEAIDIITAGWPCQPWSLAGQRKGPNDERAIWPEIARAIRELRPRYVALENVSAVVGVGELARALGDLAALGFDAEWAVLRASDVGAPHRRERCFILAAARHSDVFHLDWRRPAGQQGQAGPTARRGEAAAHPGYDGREGRPERVSRASAGVAAPRGGDPARRGVDARRLTLLPTPRTSDTNGGGVHGDGGLDLRTAVTLLPSAAHTDWSVYAAAIARWEGVLGRSAPSSTEPGRNGPRLSPALPEWMMGLPDGYVTAVPGLTRSQQLHAIGNGVVPQQAAVGYSVLLGRLNEGRAAA